MMSFFYIPKVAYEHWGKKQNFYLLLYTLLFLRHNQYNKSLAYILPNIFLCLSLFLNTFFSSMVCSTNEEQVRLWEGVLIVAQRKQIQLGTMRSQVRSLALLSRLRIQHCRELWCRSQMQLGCSIAVAVA